MRLLSRLRDLITKLLGLIGAALLGVTVVTEEPLEKHRPRPPDRRIIIGGLVAFAVGLGAAAAVLGIWHVTEFWFGYLFAYLTWVAAPLGALGLLLLNLMTGGRWGISIRASAVTAALTLPFMALLFIPVYWGLPTLYMWARPGPLPEVVEAKVSYLNVPFYLARTYGAFAVWAAMAWTIRSLFIRQQRNPDDATAKRRLDIMAGAGGIFYAMSMYFIGVDWVASLEADWYSSIYGLYFTVGQGLAALALLIIISGHSRRAALSKEYGSENLSYDLGNLLLALVLFHAYLGYSQGYIIWIGDTADSITWYLHRTHGGWAIVAYIIIFMLLGLPTLAMLIYRSKRFLPYVILVALVIFGGHLLNVSWAVLPSAGEVSWPWIAFMGGFLVGAMGCAWGVAYLLIGAKLQTESLATGAE